MFDNKELHNYVNETEQNQLAYLKFAYDAYKKDEFKSTNYLLHALGVVFDKDLNKNPDLINVLEDAIKNAKQA